MKNFICKIKDLIKKYTIFSIAIAILIIIIIGFIIYNNLKNDGMYNINDADILYKTYIEDSGWTRWSKNGLTSGNLKKGKKITNIKIKIKTKTKGSFSYTLYNSKNGWGEDLYKDSKIKNQDINAINIGIYGSMSNKYDICYRTYNEKNKWLEWSCNNEINGNKDVNISLIEIKLIPKNGVMNEYLKNYEDSEKPSNIGF